MRCGEGLSFEIQTIHQLYLQCWLWVIRVDMRGGHEAGVELNIHLVAVWVLNHSWAGQLGVRR